ncbi:glycoside hydrolase family 2 TIM barrel-domain containing protein [Pullulanibacillus sp. KACC 23026]|uniref:glycoside hydrolase family 2 TIM barrel-domain containing protein n=1 Tax=Pullulanibacillus sp. KACC 23026 TaxID=3028315 RepID=UPI0023B04E51|nr:glycoside hydrolase family 2 TIM barrel-domain containing protein [Pullulanibacillus sp. KACC 23026]WEG11869.1 glycoside hydrolase family 2 TIM barrel-domain containing protein [Pullulanibacillus sp. KACC 23026]
MKTKKVLFNDRWQFAKSPLEVTDPTHLTFQPIDLPHDWLIADSLNLYENSIGWYKKTFHCSEKADHLLLNFDGVYMDSTLYVNQQLIGEWKYGYSSFEHEITDAVVIGENEILVKVVHQSPNSRWYSGAGIYRNVWLKERNKTHIKTDGIYISLNQSENNWTIEVETDLSVSEDVKLSHQIFYKENLITTVSNTLTAAPHFESDVLDRQMIQIKDPHLWSPDFPNLYQLVTRLEPITEESQMSKMEALEGLTQNIGFRTIQLDPNEGFILNGNKLKLNGVCEHHDLGALGAAFNKTALKRRLSLLKEMGVNAIRTAHNMPAPELMDLADEMGFVIVSEAFDMWERPKTTYDYARFFKEWAKTDVKSWVMRDRNHPSLGLWSIGNEIYDTHADDRGLAIAKMLMEEVRKYDPKENARVTIGSNYMPWENAQKVADLVKVAGYNYAEKYYHTHHTEHPDWIIYGSETASVVQSRGIYHFPYDASILADDDEQCSALGNSSTSWGAKSAEACILAERETPFSLGQFIWTGFDYIGEPTPYHTKNAYFGQLDTATFKKDSFYIYQAAWTDYKTHPMVHIFPYWDFSPGQMIDVRVASNAPRIELLVNGESVGTHDIDHENGTQLVGWWKIPYTHGELKAIAYDETGRVIATDVQHSFGNQSSICLTPDKDELTANGTDLMFVEIAIKDASGHMVANATNRVHVQVTGAGRLVGLDNGDSTDYDSYKGLSRRLFSGKLMAIIASTLEPGTIKLEVSSKGLETVTADYTAVPSQESLQGVSAQMKNSDSPILLGSLDELPLRKIELISESGQLFNEETKEMMVRAKLYPEEASYQEVQWSVVNETGIESNMAKIEACGHEAKVTALGDGEFRVRCTSKNGGEKVRLISQLEFKATGLGTAFKNPYEFISAGLYDYSKGELGNGNERGVATSRDGETQVGFRGIDFGSYGSDTITLPIFALSGDEYPIQIWEGMPDEPESVFLGEFIYQKESKWNVYQAETYQLPKRLKGITSICFVLHQKVHIKGFSFEKQTRAFEQNSARDCDSIYGDSFVLTDNCVENIGNNVSLVFDHMDFAQNGASKIRIYGRTPLPNNTIHIRFENQNGESNQIVEFRQSESYEEQVFNLDTITGEQKVTFIFLPGSQFDFGWFRFEH